MKRRTMTLTEILESAADPHGRRNCLGCVHLEQHPYFSMHDRHEGDDPDEPIRTRTAHYCTKFDTIRGIKESGLNPVSHYDYCKTPPDA